MRTPASRSSRVRRYYELSRTPRYTVTFALPLFVAYELLAGLLSSGHGGLRNGADVLLRGPFIVVAGPYGPAAFLGVVALAGLWLVARDLRASRGGLRMGLFAVMLAESAGLSVVFGLVVGTVTAGLLGSFHLLAVGPLDDTGWATRLMLSLGAGLYEELFFRVLLVSALAAGARRLFGTGKGESGLIAVIVGALIFSAFHYIPPFGDPLQLQSFVFRAIAGVAFSGLYLTRGFGITAWTHALYDVIVLLL